MFSKEKIKQKTNKPKKHKTMSIVVHRRSGSESSLFLNCPECKGS